MLSDAEFHNLLGFFYRPWAGFRKVRKGVKKRVRRHMQALGCANMEQYFDVLARDPDAKAACEAYLRVTISRFFQRPAAVAAPQGGHPAPPGPDNKQTTRTRPDGA